MYRNTHYIVVKTYDYTPTYISACMANNNQLKQLHLLDSANQNVIDFGFKIIKITCIFNVSGLQLVFLPSVGFLESWECRLFETGGRGENFKKSFWKLTWCNILLMADMLRSLQTITVSFMDFSEQ